MKITATILKITNAAISPPLRSRGVTVEVGDGDVVEVPVSVEGRELVSDGRSDDVDIEEMSADRVLMANLKY